MLKSIRQWPFIHLVGRDIRGFDLGLPLITGILRLSSVNTQNADKIERI